MRARKNRELTQVQFAKELGVSPTTVSRYENGLSMPKKPILYEIAKLLNVDIDYLLFG